MLYQAVRGKIILGWITFPGYVTLPSHGNFTSRESEHDFRDTVNTDVGKPLAAAVGTFSSNMPLPI